MSNKTPTTKPLILAMQEAESGIVNNVNAALQAGIPCYLLEMILDKVHRQVKDGAAREMSYAIAQQTEAEQDNAPEPEEQTEGGKDDGY